MTDQKISIRTPVPVGAYPVRIKYAHRTKDESHSLRFDVAIRDEANSMDLLRVNETREVARVDFALGPMPPTPQPTEDDVANMHSAHRERIERMQATGRLSRAAEFEDEDPPMPREEEMAKFAEEGPRQYAVHWYVTPDVPVSVTISVGNDSIELRSPR